MSFMTRRASRRISGSLLITACLACAPTPATQTPSAPTVARTTTEAPAAAPAKPAAPAGVRNKTTEITGELANSKPERIAAGTELHSADGKLVGRMRTEGDLRRAADGVLRLVTRWGLVPVHLKS